MPCDLPSAASAWVSPVNPNFEAQWAADRSTNGTALASNEGRSGAAGVGVSVQNADVPLLVPRRW